MANKGDKITSFDEVVGYEDIKSELKIISDMLNNPQKYHDFGAGINEGVILYGRPGTGKTTMANCLIKSTGRKAFICRKKESDGRFVKNIISVFQSAKMNAPSIILLDDLDKFSDCDEEDCDAEEFVTVQSCIDELKGADVFVIATANRIRKIPDSLLRAGRLGQKIAVRMPTDSEIEEIVKHYLKKIKKCEELDEKSIARMMSGESCATLENVINRAAMKAAYNRQAEISMQNILDACLDLVFDAPESSKELPESIREKIAYHEAGHAIAAEILDPGSVSIISIRETDGGDYGFVRYCRSDEKMNHSAEYIEDMIKTSLAGRAATELVFGESDIGANNDLHNAFNKTEYLIDDICMYGFHNWIQDKDSNASAENRNRAMAMLMEKNYLEVKKILARHRELLDKLASELLQKTTLVYSDVQRICKQMV
ncbi:AAA family ATPase [Butyrivibrio sp. AC2005]|uniref:AAA family ATPase n=1 Tax=Butyrivibrio sp. AC2005 TaxID=1280672 RepID=UPI0009DB8C28|nr:AAA family ATPase [Butyrivibrio sp. AC2005]